MVPLKPAGSVKLLAEEAAAMSKRTVLLTTLIVLGSTLLTAHTASSQPNQFQGVELSIVPVAGNVYMVQRPGGGGNIGAFIGPE